MIKLPFLPKFKKVINKEYYLVLILRQDFVDAVVFEEEKNNVNIIGTHSEYFSKSLEEADTEEFLEVLDKAISQAESPLPENIQTQKTIFGVIDSWAENNQIKKEHLIKLKKACSELTIIPIGFLVLSDAIVHFLQKEEGAPVSAILVEVNKKTVSVTLIKNGKIIESKSSEIQTSIPFTVDTLLKYFHTKEVLPSRIIIFNGGHDLSQQFIGYSFSKSLPFLHIPQITTLPNGFDAKSVLFGVATQMGFEVLDSPEKDAIDSKDSKMVDEDFGFVINQDIAKSSSVEEVSNIQEEQKEVSTPKKNRYNFLTLATINLGRMLRIVKKVKLPKGKLIIITPIIGFVFIGILASYFLFVKAEVVISIEPNIKNLNQKIVFSENQSSDSNKNIIKGEFVAITEEGTISTSATGKKEIGDKSKGEVTIFNSLSIQKTLPEGTVIKSPNNLEFTLDREVSIKGVASHSADEIVSPEKANVNVTALKIGKEYNLPSGTKFIIEDFEITDLVAKNDNPFSGGTKKEVTVVSEKDFAKLRDDIKKQLEKEALFELEKKLDKDSVLLPVSVSSNLVKETFDGEIDDEKDTITLNGSVEFKGLSYKKEDLILVSKPLLEKNLSSDKKIDLNNIKTSVLGIQKSKSNNIDAEISIKALIVPKIDEKKLISEIKGKSQKQAEDKLYKLSDVANVDFVFNPNLPFLPKNLPILQNNIKIITKIAN